MSWSSNNGDDSPWGKNSKDNSKSSYNGSGRKNSIDDFFDNFQDRLKNLFPKKSPASLSLILVILVSIKFISSTN